MIGDIYYVYIHRDPRTKEVVYIGKGKYGRAWDVTRSRNTNQEHQLWMQNKSIEGYLPCDWVEIKKKNLSEKKARQLETELIHKTGITKFNRQSGDQQHQAKLTNAQAIEIYKRCNYDNESPKEIAKEFSISKAAVYALIKRRQWKTITKGLE